MISDNAYITYVHIAIAQWSRKIFYVVLRGNQDAEHICAGMQSIPFMIMGGACPQKILDVLRYIRRI